MCLLVVDLYTTHKFCQHGLITKALRAAHWQRELRRYYRQLARSVLARKGNDYWEYHRARLDEMGEPLRIPKLAGAVAGYLVERISRPRDLITSVAKRSRKRQIP